MMPLICKRHACDVVPFSYGAAHGLFYSRYAICQLQGNSGYEFGRIADVTTASREEEACCEPPLVIVFPCNSVCNCRLSRAGKTIQLEDGLSIPAISPLQYLLANIDSRVFEASWFVLAIVGVEGRIVCECKRRLSGSS